MFWLLRFKKKLKKEVKCYFKTIYACVRLMRVLKCLETEIEDEECLCG